MNLIRQYNKKVNVSLDASFRTWKALWFSIVLSVWGRRLVCGVQTTLPLRWADYLRLDMPVPWEAIQKTWYTAVLDAITATAVANPAERFYAGAFWLVFGDYTQITVPVFGMNSEDSDPDIRWHPPDWRWSIIDVAHEQLKPHYESLRDHGDDAALFDEHWNRQIDVLSHVSKQVTQVIRHNKFPAAPNAFAPDFFVGIIDFSHGEEGEEFLRRSVDEETIIRSGVLEDE